MANRTFPEPRSILFVPADAERFIAKAGTRGADSIVLDLEDGVAASAKAAAREGLATNIARLRDSGAVVFVRVNNEPEVLADDVHAAVAGNAHGLVMPKVDSPEQLVALDARILEIERKLKRPPDDMAVIGLIESPVGICRAYEIAQSTPRLAALCLGSEDFAAAMSVEPSPEALSWPAHAVAVASVAAGIQPLGLPGSVAEFSDLGAYRDLVLRARRMGIRGATCIHPAQVTVLNEVFSPSDAELAEAEQLIAAFEAAVREGKGAIALKGRMVDEPIYQRARRLVQRARDR